MRAARNCARRCTPRQAAGHPATATQRALLRPSVARTTSPVLKTHEFCVHNAVRAYELDQYGMVNNACYVNWLQHGRHELLASLGLEHHPEIPAYALTRLCISYLKALRSQDSMLITVGLRDATRARFELQQRIIRLAPDPDHDEVVAEAEATVVMLTAASRVMRIPAFATDLMAPYRG